MTSTNPAGISQHTIRSLATARIPVRLEYDWNWKAFRKITYPNDNTVVYKVLVVVPPFGTDNKNKPFFVVVKFKCLCFELLLNQSKKHLFKVEVVVILLKCEMQLYLQKC
jgi:hypothetical protein